jgi:glycosyltransferase involved in cell wall biosynthesis
MLAGDHPELFDATRRMIGYWFWELEHIPEGMRSAIRLVDEIWAGSHFVADAFSAVSSVPVRHVPIPIPEPLASQRDRDEFPPLSRESGRFTFLTAFDHLSVTERKNPLGSIEAFRRAFTPDEGPRLVVKTMNGRARWVQHQRVLAAARDRPDIAVWDSHLFREDQMALVRHADCLVSLHRSEGLGLHLAEAMWLGTPTIATRYSGNVDFMDDSCALLVGFHKVRVAGGQGVYPPSARWADPDLDEAAAAMRALAGDAALYDRLAAAGRARMAAQPSLRDTGRHVATLLSLTDRRQ